MKESINISERSFEISDSIVICSEPRGGSTWLMSIVYCLTQSIINWEPLHPGSGVVPISFLWGDRPDIPEKNNNPEYLQVMSKILTLKVGTPWTLQFASAKDLAICSHVLTKFVRANLLLPWMTRNFQFRHKPILIVRHPIPTALSQIQAFDNNSPFANRFNIPKCVNNQRLIKHEPYLTSLRSKLERHVALWLINNLPTLTHSRQKYSWRIIYYENLIVDPVGEITKLFSDLHLPLNMKVLSHIPFRNPSFTSFKRSFNPDPVKQLNKWMSRLSADDLKKIQDIFIYFNFNLYSVSSAFPNI